MDNNCIDNVEEGNWIVFYLNTGKKCIGKINFHFAVDKELNIIKEELVSYLDEDGFPGTIRKENIPGDYKVVVIDMQAFFEKQQLNRYPRKSLKLYLKTNKN